MAYSVLHYRCGCGNILPNRITCPDCAAKTRAQIGPKPTNPITMDEATSRPLLGGTYEWETAYKDMKSNPAAKWSESSELGIIWWGVKNGVLVSGEVASWPMSRPAVFRPWRKRWPASHAEHLAEFFKNWVKVA